MIGYYLIFILFIVSYSLLVSLFLLLINS